MKMEELSNTQDFVIEDEKTNEISMDSAFDPLDELVNHDFTSDGEINLDESYEMISLVERESKANKALEAENIIDELGSQYLESEFLSKLNKAFDNMKAYIKKYDIETSELKSMSDGDKTKIYAIGSFLNKNVGYLLNDLLFNITLTRDEYKFLSSAIEQKLSYDGNDVFNIIELNERFLKEWKQIDKSLSKEVPQFVVNIDIKNVVMLYHFLGKHSVKGLAKEFYIFAGVLQKIANTNKLFNAYNIIKDRLNVDFSIWVGAMDAIGAQTIDTQMDEKIEE